MIRVLQLIFIHDLNPIRPLKLFSITRLFCTTFFEPERAKKLEDDGDKVHLERRAFVDKLNEIEGGLGRSVVKELGWDELLLGNT